MKTRGAHNVVTLPVPIVRLYYESRKHQQQHLYNNSKRVSGRAITYVTSRQYSILHRSVRVLAEAGHSHKASRQVTRIVQKHPKPDLSIQALYHAAMSDEPERADSAARRGRDTDFQLRLAPRHYFDQSVQPPGFYHAGFRVQGLVLYCI